MMCGIRPETEESLEQRIYQTISEISQSANRFFNWLDEKFSFLDPEPITWEYRGIVHSCEPLPILPEQSEPYPYCQHRIRFMDGEEFLLEFPDVEFSAVASMLRRGQAIQIIYTNDQRIEELHPLKDVDFQVKTFRELLDEVDLDYDRALIKVRYEPHTHYPMTLELIPEPPIASEEDNDEIKIE